MKMQKLKKVYNVSLSAKIWKRCELQREGFRKKYYLVDRKTNVAKVFWIILKLLIEGKEINTWVVAEEFFKAKKGRNVKIFSSHVAELWSYLRLLEKHGFISVQRTVRGKKSRILVTPLIYLSLLIKFYADCYGSQYANPKITVSRIDQIFPLFSQIPLALLFLVKDCVDFVEGKSEETPLARAVRRIWFLAYQLKFLENFPFYDKLVQVVENPGEKALLLLAKEVELTPDEKITTRVEKELKELGWEVEVIKRDLEEYKRILIKKYVTPELKKRKRMLDRELEKLIKKAKKGVWDENYFRFWETL